MRGLSFRRVKSGIEQSSPTQFDHLYTKSAKFAAVRFAVSVMPDNVAIKVPTSSAAVNSVLPAAQSRKKMYEFVPSPATKYTSSEAAFKA